MQNKLLPTFHAPLHTAHAGPTTRDDGTLQSRLTNAAVGFGAFIAACLALRAVLPFPEIDQISEKLRFFSAHKHEFDTLFIGSSHILHQVSPETFDRVTRESGQPTRSFNFGIGGMHPPESAYLLEQVLKTRPRNLKWVFVEFDELHTDWFAQGEGSRRALYWHDWKRTSVLLRKVLGRRLFGLPNLKKNRDFIWSQEPEEDTRKLFLFHAGLFAKNFTNVGRAGDMLDHFSKGYMKKGLRNLGPAGDGYVPITRPVTAEQTQIYEHKLTIATTKPRRRLTSSYTTMTYRLCAQKVRNSGAAPIFLVPPSLIPNFAYRNGSGPPGLVMAFNDLAAYPNLFRTDVRLDDGHLTKPGAEEFTQILATKFIQLLQAGEIK